MTNMNKPLTVGDLIKQLRKLDPTATVVINDAKLGMVSAQILVDSLHYDAQSGRYSYFNDDGRGAVDKHLIVYGKKDDKRPN